MDLFTVIEDAQVILRSKGVHRQVKLYRRGRDVYAGHGAGFIRLHRNGVTAMPTVTWEETNLDEAVTYDPMGRMQLRDGHAFSEAA